MEKTIDSLKKIRIKLLKTFSRIQNINSFNSITYLTT